MNSHAHAEERTRGCQRRNPTSQFGSALVAITGLEVFLAYEELQPAVMLTVLVVLSVVKAAMIMALISHALEILRKLLPWCSC